MRHVDTRLLVLDPKLHGLQTLQYAYDLQESVHVQIRPDSVILSTVYIINVADNPRKI